MKSLLPLPIIIIDLFFSLSIAIPLFAIIYFFKIVLPVSKEMFNVMGDNVGTWEPGILVNMNEPKDYGEGIESIDEMQESEAHWKIKERIGAL